MSSWEELKEVATLVSVPVARQEGRQKPVLSVAITLLLPTPSLIYYKTYYIDTSFQP